MINSAGLIYLLMQNVKQGSCEYQLLKSLNSTQRQASHISHAQDEGQP